MIFKFTISIYILFLVTHDGTCQLTPDSLRQIYDKEVIYFTGNRYVKNDIKYHINNLYTEFDQNSEAFELYKLYLIDNRKAALSFLTTMGGFITGIAVINKNEKLGTGLMITSLIPATLMIHFGERSDKRLKKAVWLRNRDVLLQSN